MKFRVAVTGDIPQMMAIRMSVKENRLPDPALVTADMYAGYIHDRGRGWVCEKDRMILGFAVVDLIGKNVWALFVDPAAENSGIGKQLHRMMLNWYFTKTNETLWLSTEPGSRAERFYINKGWACNGFTKSGEVKFIMTKSAYQGSVK